MELLGPSSVSSAAASGPAAASTAEPLAATSSGRAATTVVHPNDAPTKPPPSRVQGEHGAARHDGSDSIASLALPEWLSSIGKALDVGAILPSSFRNPSPPHSDEAGREGVGALGGGWTSSTDRRREYLENLGFQTIKHFLQSTKKVPERALFQASSRAQLVRLAEENGVSLMPLMRAERRRRGAAQDVKHVHASQYSQPGPTSAAQACDVAAQDAHR